MKTIIVLLGLFMLPEPHLKQFSPDCGKTHCQITVEEAEAIQAMTRDAIGSIQFLLEENKRLKAQRCPASA